MNKSVSAYHMCKKIQYVKENEVYEEFLGFVQIYKMDAQTIADKIISSVTIAAGV